MDTTLSAHAAALWVGLHLILLIVLSARVVGQRRHHKVGLGDGGVPTLARAIRAFGNATEYIPCGRVGLAVLAMTGAAPLVVHTAGVLLFAGRVVHAVGVSRSGGASLARVAGMIMTWLAYIVIAVALVFYAIP